MNEYFLEGWLLYLVAVNFALPREGVFEKVKCFWEAEVRGFDDEYDEIWISLDSFNFNVISELLANSVYQLFMSIEICSDIDSVTLTEALF